MGTVRSRPRCRGGSSQDAGAVLKEKHKPVSPADHDKIKSSCDHSQQISDRPMVLTTQTHEAEGKYKNKEGFLCALSKPTLCPQVSSRSLCDKCFSMANSQSSKTAPQSLLCYGSTHNPVCSCQDRSYRSPLSTKSVEDKVLYQHLNLDNHPAVTCLQNEQNLRLEGMEQRMNKIRKNAQQEAERRKFAHLFRARTDDSLQTERLLKEASVALELLKKEKEQKKSCKQRDLSSSVDSNTVVDKHLVPSFTHLHDNDKGDIIPVHIVLDEQKSPNRINQEKQFTSEVEKPLMWLLQPVEPFHLSGLILWLVLPFLLPVLLLLHLVQHLSPRSDIQNQSHKKN